MITSDGIIPWPKRFLFRISELKGYLRQRFLSFLRCRSCKVELEAPEDSIGEIGMSSLLSSQGTSYRHSESLEALDHLSKRVVERRVEGELPLGQVPNAG